MLLAGTRLTVLLTIVSMSLALVLGLALALLRGSRLLPVRLAAAAYVDFVRSTPLILQLFYIYFVLPFVGLRLPALVAGVAGLSLNYSAYISEVYRSAIGSVDPGQREAAAVLGLRELAIMRRVILPQALRFAVPPLGNYLVSMFKDTALVATISVEELLFSAENLASETYRYLDVFTLTFGIYFLISYPGVLLVRYLERALARGRSPTKLASTARP